MTDLGVSESTARPATGDDRPLPFNPCHRDVLLLIRQSIAQQGHAPSRAFMANELGFPRARVDHAVRRLESCGYLRRNGDCAGGIELLDAPLLIQPVPPKPPRPARADLTEANMSVLAVIQRGIAEEGCAPTFAQIAKLVGLTSVGGVEHHVERLTRLEYLVREPERRTGKLRVVKPLPLPQTRVTSSPRRRRSVDGDDLSEAQMRVFLAIQQFMDENGFAPINAEIARLTGHKSGNGLSAHLDTLERKGYVARVRNRPRHIVLLKRVVPPAVKCAAA